MSSSSSATVDFPDIKAISQWFKRHHKIILRKPVPGEEAFDNCKSQLKTIYERDVVIPAAETGSICFPRILKSGKVKFWYVWDAKDYQVCPANDPSNFDPSAAPHPFTKKLVEELLEASNKQTFQQASRFLKSLERAHEWSVTSAPHEHQDDKHITVILRPAPVVPPALKAGKWSPQFHIFVKKVEGGCLKTKHSSGRVNFVPYDGHNWTFADVCGMFEEALFPSDFKVGEPRPEKKKAKARVLVTLYPKIVTKSYESYHEEIPIVGGDFDRLPIAGNVFVPPVPMGDPPTAPEVDDSTHS